MSYSEAMAEKGRKGGLARGKKYLKTIRQAIMLYITQPQMTQKDIAEKLGVSQAFVSKYTNHPVFKSKRLMNKGFDLDEEQLLKLLLKIDLDRKLIDIDSNSNYLRIKESGKRNKI